MPAHTKAGWEAFAEHAAEGAEAAWASYVAAARLNFHGDAAFVLPAYGSLAADQKDALEAAVALLDRHQLLDKNVIKKSVVSTTLFYFYILIFKISFLVQLLCHRA